MGVMFLNIAVQSQIQMKMAFFGANDKITHVLVSKQSPKQPLKQRWMSIDAFHFHDLLFSPGGVANLSLMHGICH